MQKEEKTLNRSIETMRKNFLNEAKKIVEKKVK